MTREEAYEWNENTHDVTFTLEVEEMQESIFYLLKKVYNDFESRTCENCKHKYVVDAMTVECRDNDSMLEYLDLDCFPDFGCNKFERKE